LIRALVEKGADINKIYSEEGTPLVYAIRKPSVAQVKILLECGAKPDIPVRDIYPLCFAVLSNKPELVRLLLEHGAEIEQTNERSLSALHMAAQIKNADILDVLLEAGADPNFSYYGSTALHAAAAVGNLKSARKLLAKGANPALLDSAGKTAAQIAEEKHLPELAAALRAN
jgi:ankyrin repeat protein